MEIKIGVNHDSYSRNLIEKNKHRYTILYYSMKIIFVYIRQTNNTVLWRKTEFFHSVISIVEKSRIGLLSICGRLSLKTYTKTSGWSD